jgi:hypothetical protein
MAAPAKSSSATSLRVAGVELSHIPKRATQHSVCLPGYEVQLCALKPGQVSVQRQVYMEEAKPLKETYAAEDGPQKSNYQELLSRNAKVDHYLNPTRPIRPTEPPSASLGHQGTAHWASEQKSMFNPAAIEGATYHRQTGPSYQAANPPTCVGRPEDSTMYQDDFGKKGTSPHDKVTLQLDRLPIFKTALTFGTPKGTNHIPGYQGFLPTNTSNPHVARVESGSSLRLTDKTNLTEQFHTNLTTYSGHKPMNPNNDRGPVRVSNESTCGRSFKMPALNAFD